MSDNEWMRNDNALRRRLAGGLYERRDLLPPDTLPTGRPTEQQATCKAQGHGWRNGCHCDEGGFVCRSCGMHEHYAR